MSESIHPSVDIRNLVLETSIWKSTKSNFVVSTMSSEDRRDEGISFNSNKGGLIKRKATFKKRRKDGSNLGLEKIAKEQRKKMKGQKRQYRRTFDEPTPQTSEGDKRNDHIEKGKVINKPDSSRTADHDTSKHFPEETNFEENYNSKLKPSETKDDDNDAFSREFYLADDESGFILDKEEMASSGNMGRFLFESAKTRAREEEMQRKRIENPAGSRISARKSALMDDQDAWEENRLLSSGAAVKGEVSLNMSTDDDARVTLLVHQVKPPFLDGRVSFSTLRDAVPTVKDASSDFARMAREGSATLRHLRENKDKHAMRQRFWELGGTRMGDVVGIKAEKVVSGDEDRTKLKDDGEIDYKKSAGFAAHVKAEGAVSEFAKTKSIREQREYLPIFSVREELLNVVRENSVLIIVGETGSGTYGPLSQRTPIWLLYYPI